MKGYTILLAAILIAASCSAPKQAYYFDHVDYHAGKKSHLTNDVAEGIKSGIQEPALKLDPGSLVASADKDDIVLAEPKAESEPVKTYKEMTKAERKEFRKEAKTLMKNYIKAKKSGDEIKAREAAAAMDHDLKLAAIFGAVGLVALIIGGDVFWVIGGIALIIGVVFFVLWLSRQ